MTTAEAGSRLQSRLLTPPLIAGTVILAGIVAAVQGSLVASVLRGALVLLLVPCAAIDIDRRLIPNRLTGPGALFALLAGLALDPGGEPRRLLWAALAGGFLLLAALVNSAGMGMGDVKLLGAMGLFLGAPVAVALMVALLANIAGALVLSTRRGLRGALRSYVPFGPYLALGGLVAALVGNPLLHAYLGAHM